MAESGNEPQPFLTCGLGRKEPVGQIGISLPLRFFRIKHLQDKPTLFLLISAAFHFNGQPS